jgi:hypothetical protein
VGDIVKVTVKVLLTVEVAVKVGVLLTVAEGVRVKVEVIVPVGVLVGTAGTAVKVAVLDEPEAVVLVEVGLLLPQALMSTLTDTINKKKPAKTRTFMNNLHLIE